MPLGLSAPAIRRKRNAFSSLIRRGVLGQKGAESEPATTVAVFMPAEQCVVVANMFFRRDWFQDASTPATLSDFIQDQRATRGSQDTECPALGSTDLPKGMSART
jgi:hypothetical protein